MGVSSGAEGGLRLLVFTRFPPRRCVGQEAARVDWSFIWGADMGAGSTWTFWGFGVRGCLDIFLHTRRMIR